jgi:hypothetical protein
MLIYSLKNRDYRLIVSGGNDESGVENENRSIRRSVDQRRQQLIERKVNIFIYYRMFQK